jgi:hypothetical protein
MSGGMKKDPKSLFTGYSLDQTMDEQSVAGKASNLSHPLAMFGTINRFRSQCFLPHILKTFETLCSFYPTGEEMLS